MAPRKGFKTFFSQGQNRSYKSAPDNFNPFAAFATDIDDFSKAWKKGKINIFLLFGGVALDIEALKKAYPGAAETLGARGKGRMPLKMEDVVKLRNALKVVEDLLDTKNSKTRRTLQKIAKQAYINVVPKALDAYLTTQGARHILAVGGAEQSPKKHKFAKTFWQVSGKGQYSKLWEKVVDIILDGIGKSGRTKYLKTTTKGVESFNLNDLLSVEIGRSKSKYRSVFLMEEFGTGQMADPNKRLYESKGLTFFKVPPYLIRAVQGRIGAAQLKIATAAWYITSGALAYGEGQYKAYLKLKGKKGKKGLADAALERLARNIENWTYGYKKGETHFGREARHLFFEKGRIAKAIRDIQFKAQEEFVRVFNQEVRKLAPEFPGLVATLVTRG